MRTLILILAFGLGLFSSRFAAECQAQPQVTLGWNVVTNANVAGYYLAWGTNGTKYSSTNIYPSPNTTSGTVGNLSFGVLYNFAVASFSTNSQNPISPYSSNVTYITNAVSAAITGGPPSPPLPPGANQPGGARTANTQNSSSAGSSSSSSAASSTAASSTNVAQVLTQAELWGIPPYLIPFMSNGQYCLSIEGTLGATYVVQYSPITNIPLWTPVTNLVMTNTASIASNTIPGEPQDAIDLAFVPSYETVVLPLPTNGVGMHQIVMPYDYAILANITLKPKGFATRLISVNLVGGSVDDGCYVSQASSFIHYVPGTATNSILQLVGSGSTIRQIATTLANNLGNDWTTASEFTYTNGTSYLLATVVEADPPSSDPVAGNTVIGTITTTSSIAIDF